MKNFIKAVLYNPKLWRVLLVSILTFLGYNEAVRYIDAEQVDPVEPLIIQGPVEKEHTHKEHVHKNWLPIIRNEIKKAKEAHNDNHHGGN